MKTRIIAAAVLIPILLIVVLALPKIWTAILFGFMAAVAAYELLCNTGYVRHTRLVVYSMVMAFLVSVWCYYGQSYVWGLLGVLLFCVALFSEMMLSHVKLRFEKIALCFVAGLLLPFLFTSLVRIHAVEGTGRYFVLIPVIIAFISDSFAYFTGIFLGHHKLAPVISPNKTVEGALGGIVGAIGGMLLYSLVLDLAFGFEVNYLYACIYGLAGSLGDMFGDLCFSIIKRQTGIKDYGTLIPGHGGVLDRFDSMMVVGPISELLLILLPLAVK